MDLTPVGLMDGFYRPTAASPATMAGATALPPAGDHALRKQISRRRSPINRSRSSPTFLHSLAWPLAIGHKIETGQTRSIDIYVSL